MNDAAGNDATTDVGTDAPATRFCESQSPAPTFCRDFDVGNVGDGWTSSQLTLNTNVIALDPLHHSAPSSFLSRAQSTGDESLAVLSKELKGSVLDTAFWIRIGTPAARSR